MAIIYSVLFCSKSNVRVISLIALNSSSSSNKVQGTLWGIVALWKTLRSSWGAVCTGLKDDKTVKQAVQLVGSLSL